MLLTRYIDNMIFQNCESKLFLCIFIVIIAVTSQSKEKETNISYTECQWNEFTTGSKNECTLRCSGYFGFWDKISNKLVCYHKKGISVPINRFGESCVCGYIPQKGRSHAVPCIPMKEFKDTTNMRQCKLKCGEIKIYKYASERSIKISSCDDSDKCALRSDLLNESTDSKDEPQEDNPEIESTKICKLGEFAKSHKNRCAETCQTAKGFIPKDSTELVCYHRAETTQVISLNETCQCGVLVVSIGHKSVYECVPNIIHTTINAKSTICSDICLATRAYVFNTARNVLRVTRCERDNLAQRSESFDGLEHRIGTHRRVPTSSGKKRSEYPCECGVGGQFQRDLNFMGSAKWKSKKREYHVLMENNGDSQRGKGIYQPSSSNRINEILNIDENSGYSLSANHIYSGSDVDLFYKISDNNVPNLPADNLFPNVDRNNSLPAGRSGELVQSEEVSGIPTPTIPITPQTQSFEIIDNLFEYPPVANSITPASNQCGMASDEAIPFSSSRRITNIENNKNRGSSSQATINRDCQINNTRPVTISLFSNEELSQPSPIVPENNDLYDMIFPKKQFIPTRGFNKHSDIFNRGMGCASISEDNELTLHPSPNLPANNDLYDMIFPTNQFILPENFNPTQNLTHYRPNVSTDNNNMPIFPNNVGWTPSSNDPANNSLGDMIFPTNHIVSPGDFNEPSTNCCYGAGSLEPLKDSYFPYCSNDEQLQFAPPNALSLNTMETSSSLIFGISQQYNKEKRLRYK